MTDDWTVQHDLALIYLALAYGPDHQLADRELAVIEDALAGWRPEGLTRDAARETALEALAVLLSGEYDPDALVDGVLDRLAGVLTHEERQRAIEDVIRIAEADGMLLRAERAVIALIAKRWQVKGHAQLLLDATRGDEEDWTLLHDIALVYIIVGHSTDGELTQGEISTIVGLAREWQPAWSEEEVRAVLRRALSYYSTDPGAEGLQRAVLSIGHRLPLMQRLALVNDLYAIAEADGLMLDTERDMIASLMDAWGVAPLFADARPGSTA